MPEPMEPGRFARESQEGLEKIVSALSTNAAMARAGLGSGASGDIAIGRVFAYDGWINGTSVIVIGWRRTLRNTVPLCVLMTEEMFELLDVQATKSGTSHEPTAQDTRMDQLATALRRLVERGHEAQCPADPPLVVGPCNCGIADAERVLRISDD